MELGGAQYEKMFPMRGRKSRQQNMVHKLRGTAAGILGGGNG